VLVVLMLEPVTQQGMSASALVTSRLSLFVGVKENRLSVFGSVIDYRDTHSLMVLFFCEKCCCSVTSSAHKRCFFKIKFFLVTFIDCPGQLLVLLLRMNSV
jgi:hypothetical protein